MPRATISRRAAAVTPSATLRIDAAAKELRAAGHHIISFAAGEPDFATPDHVVEAARAASLNPGNHRYSPTAGLPELREAIAAKALRDSGADIGADDVLVTNGGKQAVYEALQTVVDPGDDVLLPAPYWTTYPEAIRLAGGNTLPVVAGPASGFKVTPSQLDAALTDRTTALVFVSPSNPTGAVYSPDEVRAIGQWALENNLWVISDEIYQNLVYEGRAMSIAEAVPELASRLILVNGVAKTYAMTGWRVGWLAGPPDVIRAATDIQSHLTSNVSNVAQQAALAALTGPQDAAEHMRLAFDRRRHAILEGLSAIPGIDMPTPRGAFYAYVDVSNLLGLTFDGTLVRSSADLAEVILRTAGVAVVPGEAFGRSGDLRLSYALGDEDLAEGLRRLSEMLG